jgi:hypothetical protein
MVAVEQASIQKNYAIQFRGSGRPLEPASANGTHTMTRTRRATRIHGHAPAPRYRFFLPRSGPEKNRDYKSSRSTKGAKMMQSMLSLIYSEFLKSTFPDAELQA